MNKFDITNYLVEPDFAKFLKEQGFDAKTSHFYTDELKLRISTSDNGFVSGGLSGNIAAPSFSQAFDFVEEKFNIWPINVDKNVSGYGFHLNKEYYGFKTKLEANIAAIKAIMDYVNSLK